MRTPDTVTMKRTMTTMALGMSLLGWSGARAAFGQATPKKTDSVITKSDEEKKELASRSILDYDEDEADPTRVDPQPLGYPYATPGGINMYHWSDYTRTHMVPGSAQEEREERRRLQDMRRRARDRRINSMFGNYSPSMMNSADNMSSPSGYYRSTSVYDGYSGGAGMGGAMWNSPMATAGDFVYVVRGNTLFKLNANDMSVAKQQDLPAWSNTSAGYGSSGYTGSSSSQGTSGSTGATGQTGQQNNSPANNTSNGTPNSNTGTLYPNNGTDNQNAQQNNSPSNNTSSNTGNGTSNTDNGTAGQNPKQNNNPSKNTTPNAANSPYNQNNGAIPGPNSGAYGGANGSSNRRQRRSNNRDNSDWPANGMNANSRYGNGTGMYRGMSGFGPVSVSAGTDYVYVLRGDTIYRFQASDLSLVSQKTLPSMSGYGSNGGDNRINGGTGSTGSVGR